jgi:hypothetical protein
MQIFQVQHNNRKQHLVDSEFNVACGHKNSLNYTCHHDLVLKDNEFYERSGDTEFKLSSLLVSEIYCKKCINKILNK